MTRKTAVVVLATEEYWRGAKILFHSLRKVGGLHESVTPIALGMDRCDFAEAVPITKDYSWIHVSKKHFPRVADKFFGLTLDYDRIVMLDADMLCVGDCSYLWSDHVGTLPFYACRDTASNIYYGDVIRQIGLDPLLIFNAGTMIFHRVDLTDILSRIASAELIAYDGGDQGYLNCYYQKVRPGEAGWLPSEYNCSMDKNMPQTPRHSRKIIHFTGGNANPWNHWGMQSDDPRMEYYAVWDQMWEECDR